MWPRFKNWEREDPMEEPICTMGPSLPTEAPEEMSSAVTTALSAVTLCLIRPCLRARAFMTSGTPGPLSSGAQKAITGPAARPTRHGTARRQTGEAFIRCPANVVPGGHSASTPHPMSFLKSTAPNPASIPIARESKSGDRVLEK